MFICSSLPQMDHAKGRFASGEHKFSQMLFVFICVNLWLKEL